MTESGPIGVFDSGYGGLTVLKAIEQHLPQYDYIYLGDNARTPYGNRSFETVYRYTLECVEWFFKQGCPLVILACNTASAKALRTIQQQNLPHIDPSKRVLGVIRPTTEVIGNFSKTRHIGILATNGTVASQSYILEMAKLFPDVHVHQQACPMWVPLIENNDYDNAGADYFIEKYTMDLMAQHPQIDTVLLACTHYPLLKEKISKYLPVGIQLLSQGEIVAESLADYLNRHPNMKSRLTKGQSIQFFTTDDAADFNNHAAIFYGKPVSASQITL